MTTARLYSYTDSGAPALTGQQGTLKDLLKKILVGTAGVAYGTGINEKLALGWSALYETVDKAIFQGGVGASGMLLRVDDSGSGAGSYREAFAFGCESATGVDAFTDRFPTTTQLSAGVVWRKSQNLNSTAVPWWAWGDDRTFWIMINWFGTNFAALYGFGDFASLKNADPYNALVLGGALVNTSGSVPTALQAAAISAVDTLTYAARSHNGATKSVALGASMAYHAAGSLPGSALANLPAYPAAVVSGVLATPILAHEANMPRGRLRGIHAPLHSSGLTAWSAISGISGMPLASLTPTQQYGNSFGNLGVVLAETGTELT